MCYLHKVGIYIVKARLCRLDEETTVFMWPLREKEREEERSFVCLSLLAQMNHRLKCDSSLRFQLSTAMGLRIAQ